MYQRNQLLHKIQDETEKARSLLDARAQLQQQRKMANMGASFQRQKLLQAMESCRLLRTGQRTAQSTWTRCSGPTTNGIQWGYYSDFSSKQADRRFFV